MENYKIEDIECIRKMSNLSYEDAVALLDFHNGNLARALMDLENHGKLNANETVEEAGSAPELQARSGGGEENWSSEEAAAAPEATGDETVQAEAGDAPAGREWKTPQWCPLKYVSAENWALAVLPVFGIVFVLNDFLLGIIFSIVGLYVRKKWPYAVVAIVEVIYSYSRLVVFNFFSGKIWPNLVMAVLALVAIHQITKLGVKAFDKNAEESEKTNKGE